MRYVLVSLILLAACDTFHSHEYEVNQKQRQRIFKECLELIPEGPKSVKYNDWAEVVEECEYAAYYQSKERVCKH